MRSPPGLVLLFSWCKVFGKRVLISGHLPLAADGSVWLVTDKVGAGTQPDRGGRQRLLGPAHCRLRPRERQSRAFRSGIRRAAGERPGRTRDKSRNRLTAGSALRVYDTRAVDTRVVAPGCRHSRPAPSSTELEPGRNPRRCPSSRIATGGRQCVRIPWPSSSAACHSPAGYRTRRAAGTESSDSGR